jgi:squalene-hopene/tetraprenyl-beta-curcumene cyclase
MGHEVRDLGPVIDRGLDYLATQQNPDGGFGDTDLSHSNIATTMLVRAAIHLAGVANHDKYRNLLSHANRYIEEKGGIPALRARYGKDKTFAVPILTNCALAGLVDWREVSPLPFELATFPQSWYRFFRLPVVSYAIPALVAIGQARFFHLPPRNPVARLIRRATIQRSLNVLERMQPESGGYLEAIPLTSFVVMSLAGTGRGSHAVARRGVQFLIDTVRPDGSWPIDTNLATWVTTLAMAAISHQPSAISLSNEDSSRPPIADGGQPTARPGTWDLGPGTIEWLLSCQHTERHPFTGASPGGWGWSDLSGAVPDADDTSGALLTLARFAEPAKFEPRKPHGPGLYGSAYGRALRGICWLANLQNRDGGWPTFCRGWGALPFDRSAPDLTAHALRAINAWLPLFGTTSFGTKHLVRNINRGLIYLQKSQRVDGSWSPLWFGNQYHPNEENPIYGTSKVLLAYRDLGRMGDNAAVRGLRWLITAQNQDGGWGAAAKGSGCRVQGSANDEGQRTVEEKSRRLTADSRQLPLRPGTWDLGLGTVAASPVLNTPAASGSSVEETALAVAGLLSALDNADLCDDNSLQIAIRQGVDWLVRAVEDGRHRQPAPIGFYFAKLWYYERLYPLAFAVEALGEAVRRLHFDEKRRAVAETINAER